MKRAWVMGLALLAPGAALGADATVFSAAPAVTWTGAYFGATLGATMPSTSGFGVAGAYAPFEERSSSGGLSVGGKVGLNLQDGAIVVGIEADAQTANTDISTNYIDRSSAPSASNNMMARANWLSTLRARFGFLATPSMLIYATAGLALAEFEMTDTWTIYNPALINAGLLPGTKSHFATNIGWVVGGGIEYALTSKWSASVEAMYADFGTVSYRDIDAFGRVMLSRSGEASLGLARAGINYRF